MIAGSDPPPSDEQTFADVLNALTFGARPAGGRRGRRRGRTRREPDTAPAAGWTSQLRGNDGATAQPPAADATDATEATAADPGPENDTETDVAAIVRPYAWTRGRTRTNLELQVETLVSATQPPGASAPPEHRTIAELCRLPQSVAEVAAALDVPLGVAKVLIGDMAEAGLLAVHRTAATSEPQAHLMLMERVLSGLRRL